VDHGVEGREVDPRPIRRQHGDQRIGGLRAGEGRQVEGPVHGRAGVRVVGPGGDHGADPALREARELGGDTLHRSPGLRVRVEEVPRDEEQVHLLGDGQVHARPERLELALPLGGGGLAEAWVAGAEMHVGSVEESQHAVTNLPRPDPGGA
jgi:hypothetical protein